MNISKPSNNKQDHLIIENQINKKNEKIESLGINNRNSLIECLSDKDIFNEKINTQAGKVYKKVLLWKAVRNDNVEFFLHILPKNLETISIKELVLRENTNNYTEDINSLPDKIRYINSIVSQEPQERIAIDIHKRDKFKENIDKLKELSISVFSNKPIVYKDTIQGSQERSVALSAKRILELIPDQSQPSDNVAPEHPISAPNNNLSLSIRDQISNNNPTNTGSARKTGPSEIIPNLNHLNGDELYDHPYVQKLISDLRLRRKQDTQENQAQNEQNLKEVLDQLTKINGVADFESSPYPEKHENSNLTKDNKETLSRNNSVFKRSITDKRMEENKEQAKF